MNLNELSVKELARIDGICLEYEDKLRQGTADAIDDVVAKFGGKHAAIPKAELEAVALEISATEQLTHAPFGAEAGKESVRSFASPKLKPRGPSKLPDVTQGNPTAAPPTSGRMVGPYLLGDVLGRGGMGIVFKATDTRLERQVAIKVLSVVGKHQEALAGRFQREAKALAGLSHPNIVELFDVGVVDGVPFPRFLGVGLMGRSRRQTRRNQSGVDSLAPGRVLQS